MRVTLACALLGSVLLSPAPLQAQQERAQLHCESDGVVASGSRKLRINYTAKEVSLLLDDGAVKWTAPATFTDVQIKWLTLVPARRIGPGADQIGVLRLGNTQGEHIQGAAGTLDRQSGRLVMQRFDQARGWPDEFSGICRLTTQKF